MSNERAADAAAESTAAPAEAVEDPRDDAASPERGAVEDQREPVIEEVEREVTLQRSVRYGRVLIGAAVLGALVAALACLFFPIEENADYTMGQAVGFMALIGGAIGIFIGGVLALVLGAVARRQRGTGVAIQSDVR